MKKQMELGQLVAKSIMNGGDEMRIESIEKYVELVRGRMDKFTANMPILLGEDEIRLAIQYHWGVLNGCVYQKQAEILSNILLSIFLIKYNCSSKVKEYKEFVKQVDQLMKLFEDDPTQIHVRLDSGKKCTITSNMLKMALHSCLLSYSSPIPSDLLFYFKHITYELGRLVSVYEKSLYIIVPNDYGVNATYAFLGDLVYCFDGVAPNPERWKDNLNPKEKYDIVVKHWLKMYNKYKDDDILHKMAQLIEE